MSTGNIAEDLERLCLLTAFAGPIYSGADAYTISLCISKDNPPEISRKLKLPWGYAYFVITDGAGEPDLNAWACQSLNFTREMMVSNRFAEMAHEAVAHSARRLANALLKQAFKSLFPSEVIL